MFDLSTCKFVIWGAKRPFNTFGYIHAAFLRALQYMGKDAQWLECDEDVTKIDFSNTLFLTMNCVLQGLPQRKDCFYICHNIFGDMNYSYFDGLKLLGTGVHTTPNIYSKDVQILGKDIYFEPDNRSLQMRWGTDLLPEEIEANKPTRVFNSESQVVNYIGTIDYQKQPGLDGFIRACKENQIEFKTWGGFNGGPNVTIEQQVQLIKDSYMAPAFQGLDQVKTGYVSCRLFKNISAGQMGVTHSPFANDLFGGRLVCNQDTYRLFYDAKERLQSMSLKELHDLMDDTARDHTYIKKVNALITAVRTLENK